MAAPVRVLLRRALIASPSCRAPPARLAPALPRPPQSEVERFVGLGDLKQVDERMSAVLDIEGRLAAYQELSELYGNREVWRAAGGAPGWEGVARGGGPRPVCAPRRFGGLGSCACRAASSRHPARPPAPPRYAAQEIFGLSRSEYPALEEIRKVGRSRAAGAGAGGRAD
jgi:hypothetical protein